MSSEPIPGGAAGPPSAVLVGAGGFGSYHLLWLSQLEREGRLRLAGVVEPAPDRAGDPLREAVARGVPRFDDFADALDAVASPDVVSIASPPHLHEAHAVAALDAGAALLLEKPPTPTVAAFDRIAAAADRAGRPVQVDFMWHALPATRAVARVLRTGDLGAVRSVTAIAASPRGDGYYGRNRWAGRDRLDDGTVVHDGPLTNAFAHVLDMALFLAAPANDFAVPADDFAAPADDFAGQARAETVRAERYRARPITGDDLVCLRARLSGAIELTVAVAHCVDRERPTTISVHCDRGDAIWSPHLPPRIEPRDTPPFTPDLEPAAGLDGHAGVEMLRNLCAAAVDPTVDLYRPIGATRPWMELTAAVRASAPTPVSIPADFIRETGDDRVYAVDGLVDALEEIWDTPRLPSELGLPWAQATAETAVTRS